MADLILLLNRTDDAFNLFAGLGICEYERLTDRDCFRQREECAVYTDGKSLAILSALLPIFRQVRNEYGKL